nr:MAG TPA: hypothetical protein [Caudoviricetes sp.]DAY21799.1 MAG TPA: hypothetical protein [Caudoviricetes sp.]
MFCLKVNFPVSSRIKFVKFPSRLFAEMFKNIVGANSAGNCNNVSLLFLLLK